MPEDFQIETLVDTQSTAFREYLGSIIAKLAKTDKEYRAVQNKIEAIYKRYPNVMGLFDKEQTAVLSEQECEAVIEVVSLQNQLVEMETQTIYFRGCYDGVGYLKKAGIL